MSTMHLEAVQSSKMRSSLSVLEIYLFDPTSTLKTHC